MGTLRIRCNSCGEVFDVRGNRLDRPAVNSCPYCGVTMPRELWDSIIVPAVGALDDANTALENAHIAGNAPLFRIGYVPSKGKAGNRKTEGAI